MLNARRRGLVRLSFEVIDNDHSGIVDMVDIKALFDASRHPLVLQKKKTADEVLQEFVNGMEVGKDRDGKVNYYLLVFIPFKY